MSHDARSKTNKTVVNVDQFSDISMADYLIHISCESKYKQHHILKLQHSITGHATEEEGTLRNVDRFYKFFHQHTQL